MTYAKTALQTELPVFKVRDGSLDIHANTAVHTTPQQLRARRADDPADHILNRFMAVGT